MNKIYKICALVIIIGLLFIPGGVASANEAPSTEYFSDDLLCNISPVFETGTVLDIKAESVLLMEPYTGKILYEKNSEQRLAPASITKVMTLLLVMEAIENEQIGLNTQVVTSEHAASMGGSQIWLEVGETMTVDEMLRAAVIASANDATVALAELVAGSEENFVALMNKRAKELGMNNTNFVNACGLDADEHLTTAKDVAVMSSALIKHDLIKKYSTVWMDALRDGKSELVNTNKLIRYYNGATGLKTGTTSKAGCSIVATAKRNNMELVAVVMKGENSNARFAGAKKLLDFGFAAFEFAELSFDEEKIGEIKCSKGMEEQVVPQAAQTVNLLLKKGEKEKIKTEVKINEDIFAPVKKGDKIGVVSFSLNGKTVGEIPVTAAKDVEKIGFFNSLVMLLRYAFIP